MLACKRRYNQVNIGRYGTIATLLRSDPISKTSFQSLAVIPRKRRIAFTHLSEEGTGPVRYFRRAQSHTLADLQAYCSNLWSIGINEPQAGQGARISRETAFVNGLHAVIKQVRSLRGALLRVEGAEVGDATSAPDPDVSQDVNAMYAQQNNKKSVLGTGALNDGPSNTARQGQQSKFDRLDHNTLSKNSRYAEEGQGFDAYFFDISTSIKR